MLTTLPLTSIHLDDACQPRVLTDMNLAGEYAEAMLHGAVFPAVVVFNDHEGGYWLADGYHRWHAADIAGLKDIAADVRPGGKREAILHSVSANAEHGWRRSTEDKRRAVQTLLADPEWAQWSDYEIGRRCGVSHTTVARHRPASLAHCASEPRTYTDRHGNTSKMRTSGIGRRPEPEPDDDYSIHNDPRQVTVEDVIQRFDTQAADLRLRITTLVEHLLDMPTPAAAMDAWMVGRGEALSAEQVRQAVDWLTEFAELFHDMEPHRLEQLRAMQARAKESINVAE